MDGARILPLTERKFISLSANAFAASAALALIFGWLLSSTGLFTVDEYFYLRMAEAMAGEGALSFRQFDVAGAAALDMTFARQAGEAGRLIPQYPAGYALIAAPFYALFGAKGLTLVNAVAGFVVLILTFRLARRLFDDDRFALVAVGILALATYWSTYLYAVWPHMLALAIALGAIDLALRAGEGDRRAAIAAGCLIGVGESVRIDMIVLAPAIIVWLRLFCEGETRKLALIFIGATMAGLACAAGLSWLRDGAFALFSYDNGVAANDVSDFIPLAILAATTLIAVIMFDFQRVIPFGAKSLIALLVGAAIILLLAAKPALLIAHGFWYALVDAQAYAHLDRQYGIVIDEWGWLSFYGFSKKALLQSAPFAVLAILSVVRLLRGGAHRVEALLIIVSGAVAALYSFNETDSGLGLNARFLLPLLPAIAILAAAELRLLAEEAGLAPRPMLIAASAAALAFFILRFSNNEAGPLRTPIDLYPQLVLAAFLFGAVCLYAIGRSQQRALIAALLGAAAIGAGASIGASDFIQDQAYRNYVAGQARLYRAIMPGDALLFTSRPALYGEAAAVGLAVAYPGVNEAAAEKAAIDAYHAAGRCVYAHGTGALEWAVKTGLFAAPTELPNAYSQGAIARLLANPESCP